MKPLLTATTLALFLATVSTSVSAALTTTSSVQDESGNFYFYDSNLGSGMSGFGSLSVSNDIVLHHPYGMVYYYRYGYSLSTAISIDNPFIFNPTVSETYFYRHFLVGTDYKYDKYDYSQYGSPIPNSEFHAAFDQDGGYRYINMTLHWSEYDENGQIKESERYSYLFDFLGADIINDTEYTRVTEDGKVSNTPPYGTDVLRANIIDTFPFSGYGIFDFQSSLIYYADGGIESLAQALHSNQNDFPFHVDTLSFNNGNLDSLVWYSDREIIGITLAYNPIPEPETWAMLLAGLGVVGAVTRRRCISA
jgi:hypothetical protein